MGDMAEMFRAWDQEKSKRKAENREKSAILLAEKGISFEPKNAGAHLIVKHENQIIDFWPGTGKYIFRNRNKKGRGVFNLLKQLEVE